MKTFRIVLLLLMVTACSTKNRYDVHSYYDKPSEDAILTSIIAYIYTAPPYTLMKDRFRPEHRTYYATLLSKFSIRKYFVANDGTNYFYLIRPSSRANEERGVGGYFKMGDNFQLKDFHEVFVTPVLSKKELEERGAFLFDKMVKGNIKDYLKMKTYVQWPNDASEYDTALHEWALKEEFK